MLATLDYPDLRSVMPVTAAAFAITIAEALQVGTGGAQTADYYQRRGPMGYAFAPYDLVPTGPVGQWGRTAAEDLARIRAVMKPSVTDLADAMGVSRQAIYDWQNGKPIAAANAARLADFARAVDVLEAVGVTTSPQLARRTIASRKNIFDIAREGGNLEEAAKQLAQIVRREIEQRQMLSARLSGHAKPAYPAEDVGARSLDEIG